MPEISSAKLSIRPELLPFGRRSRVLDVGCGDGRHVLAAAQRACYSIGVDYDPAELRKARERLGGVRADFVAADAAHLPFRDGAVAAVICTETLEHLPDDGAALREIARVTREGGLVHGAVPSHFTEIPYFALSSGYRNAPGGHVRIYSPRALVRRLQDAGFTLHDLRYIHFVDSLVWLRFCLTDYIRARPRPRDDFEAAVLVAVASEQPVPAWRTRLRDAIGTSRFFAALDTVGAWVWPKSLMFVARKPAVHKAPEP